MNKGGYSRGVPRKLIAIIPQEDSDRQREAKEQQLQRELKQIDQVLKTDHLKNLHGLIFTHEVKNRLPEDLLNCINKNHRLITCGFNLGTTLLEDKGHLQTPGLSLSPELSFKRKLEQISVQNVEKFDRERTKQCSQLDHMKWRIVRTKHKPSLKQPLHLPSPPKPEHKNSVNILSGLSTPIRNNRTAGKVMPRVKTKAVTQAEEPLRQWEKQRDVSLGAMERLLKQIKGQVVTVWLPPKSYPQFYGLLVPSVAVTKSSAVKCRLKKYIFFKHSISARLFEAIIEYLSEMFEVYIERVELIVNREDFRSYFQKIGCKVMSWEGIDKVSISYSRAPR